MEILFGEINVFHFVNSPEIFDIRYKNVKMSKNEMTNWTCGWQREPNLNFPPKCHVEIFGGKFKFEFFCQLMFIYFKFELFQMPSFNQKSIKILENMTNSVI